MFRVAKEDEREDDADERLDSDERRNDGDAAAVVRLEERDVGRAEQDPAGTNGSQRREKPRRAQSATRIAPPVSAAAAATAGGTVVRPTARCRTRLSRIAKNVAPANA